MQAALQIGAMHAESWKQDPKHLGFVLARYKFVSKMLAGMRNVLEVGCGDCTGAQIVSEVVENWHGYDNDPHLLKVGPRTHLYDALAGPFPGEWDAVYALDFLEHIIPEQEDWVLVNLKANLTPNGVVIIGMPSKESQVHASRLSRLHHVNCKTEDELRLLMRNHFHNVFMFGMNDETLHTGFGPLCHYRLAIGAGPKR